MPINMVLDHGPMRAARRPPKLQLPNMEPSARKLAASVFSASFCESELRDLRTNQKADGVRVLCIAGVSFITGQEGALLPAKSLLRARSVIVEPMTATKCAPSSKLRQIKSLMHPLPKVPEFTTNSICTEFCNVDQDHDSEARCR